MVDLVEQRAELVRQANALDDRIDEMLRDRQELKQQLLEMGYMIAGRTNKDRFERALSAVSEAAQIPAKDITGRRRLAEVVRARHMLWYICKDKFKISLAQIGRLTASPYHCYDHTTVLHACRKVERELDIYADVQDLYKDSLLLLNDGDGKAVPSPTTEDAA